MENYQIADTLSLLAKLNDIHGENSFKSKSYAAAAFTIEKLLTPIGEMPKEKISFIKGIGVSTAQKIIELIETGSISSLESLIAKTPSGILEMLQIKGIGPKKINTIWKEMEIETLGELLYACKENRLKLYKGFGEKTQQNIGESIEFYLRQKGKYLYSDAKWLADEFIQLIAPNVSNYYFEAATAIKQQLEIVEKIVFTTNAPADLLKELLLKLNVETTNEQPDCFQIKWMQHFHAEIYYFETHDYFRQTVLLNAASDFQKALKLKLKSELHYPSELSVFEWNELPFIPAYLREEPGILETTLHNFSHTPIQKSDIKGIIHCHSNWSDGNNSLEILAETCIQKKLEYLVISDHSQSAFYAQGLKPDRIRAQHKLIDELNVKYSPFKIFKSIECDILNDGSLDYNDDILAEFDLVIASIHSQLKMSEEKAMMRLLRAIQNPYTTILGHMTGRLLLSRPGYPVNHNIIIDQCAENNVVIELNANPNRLDIDWRQINMALEKNVLISINPDAHNLEGLDDIGYGVSVAQKTKLSVHNNLSSFSKTELEDYLKKRRLQKGI